MSKRKSHIWEFFEEPVIAGGQSNDGKPQKKAACKLCDVKLADGGGTTNLTNHLWKKHQEKYKHCFDSGQSSSKQLTIRSMFQKCAPE